MGNSSIVGYFALLLWPPLSAAVFLLVRPAVAAAAVLLAGTLFLPEDLSFDTMGLPPLGKSEIASLSVMVCCVAFYSKQLARARLGRGLDILVLVLIAAGIGTAFTNGDPLVYGPTHLPPLRPYDALSMGIRDLLTIGLPYVIGRTLFRSTRDVRDLFVVLLVAALLYSILVLFEVRMSPHLHQWVYGYYQGGWQFRSGTYRPNVFMSNGLALALFLATAVIVGTAMVRGRIHVGRIPMRLCTTYLFAVLLLCKSFAAISYALVMVPVAALGRPRIQIRIAVVLSLLTTIYPMSRQFGLFPREAVISIARGIDVDRAQSLDFRFANEDRLLDKALERPLFGWGGFNRNRVFHPIRGRDLSVTDGFWIIVVGSRGAVGFLATFGLLVLPVLIAHRRIGRMRTHQDQMIVAALGLIVAVNTVDLLPNGLFTYLPFLFSGALLGVVQGSTSVPPKSSMLPRRDLGRALQPDGRAWTGALIQVEPAASPDGGNSSEKRSR